MTRHNKPDYEPATGPDQPTGGQLMTQPQPDELSPSDAELRRQQDVNIATLKELAQNAGIAILVILGAAPILILITIRPQSPMALLALLATTFLATAAIVYKSHIIQDFLGPTLELRRRARKRR